MLSFLPLCSFSRFLFLSLVLAPKTSPRRRRARACAAPLLLSPRSTAMADQGAGPSSGGRRKIVSRRPRSLRPRPPPAAVPTVEEQEDDVSKAPGEASSGSWAPG